MSLIFPAYDIPVQEKDKKQYIWDITRKKWLIFTPEEWVRQHLIHYLRQEKGIPATFIAIEREISYFQLKKRFDVVVFNQSGGVSLLCECKAPYIPISQETAYQICRYNSQLSADALLLTNGVVLYFWEKNAEGVFELKDF
jgi:hypothetical protein